MILCLFTCSVTILYPRSSLLETMKMVSNLSLESGVIRRGLIYLHLKGGGAYYRPELGRKGLIREKGLLQKEGLFERGAY